ncbi:MAG TPA: hypothetical protein VK539_32615 [Myxococcaceae bacterium]|nr:hypothetical protein [Myxococcaceae bacterium]
MNINSLSGPRMTSLSSTNNASSTARTSFGSLLQGAGAPKAGAAGQLTGGNVISAAISINNPGSTGGVGAPYQQAAPQPAAQAPAPAAGAPKPTSEFNGELQQAADTQKMEMMKQLAILSIASFASSTFSMGNNRIQLETVD